MSRTRKPTSAIHQQQKASGPWKTWVSSITSHTPIILIKSEEKQIEITLPIETQKTGWCVPFCHWQIRNSFTRSRKLNTSPNTIEDKDILKMQLINPPVKRIDLHFPLGLEVVARNSKGVTIKDALDAIYKQFKKKVSDPTRLEVQLLTGLGGWRIGKTLPGRFWVGQGRVLDPLDCSPNKDWTTGTSKQKVQEEDQGRGLIICQRRQRKNFS